MQNNSFLDLFIEKRHKSKLDASDEGLRQHATT